MACTTIEVKGPVSKRERVVRCGGALLVHEWRVCCPCAPALTPHPEQAAQHHHTQLPTALTLHTQREGEGVSRPCEEGGALYVCALTCGKGGDGQRTHHANN
jgi:hypothetical protein